MATVYSLICFGGKDGKAVSFTVTGSVVNLTNHGLRQGVTGIVFSTTGTLPAEITEGVTYYTRDGADANKFTIYPTKADAIAGTNQVTFSTTGSGTHTVKSAYMLGLTSEQLARYGSPGGERIYDGLQSWISGRQGSSTLTDVDICEVGESYTETATNRIELKSTMAAAVVICTIPGSTAHHRGSFTDGYCVTTTANYTDVISADDKYNVEISGIRIQISRESTSGIKANTRTGVIMLRDIIVQGNSVWGQIGLRLGGNAISAYNCIVSGLGSSGVSLGSYGGYASIISNVMAHACATGFISGASDAHWSVYNCVAFGCGTNWGTAPSPAPAGIFTHNAGEPGDIVWDKDLSAITSLTGGSFNNLALQDFRPANATSPQVDSGVSVYGHPDVDISGGVVPNYDPDGPQHPDIGPFEYDHGNGLAPKQVTISISGMAEGSALAIYKTSDGSAIVPPTTIGASGSHSITYPYTGDTQIEIRVRKGTEAPFYLPYKAPGLITDTGFALIVSQIPDTVLNNA